VAVAVANRIADTLAAAPRRRNRAAVLEMFRRFSTAQAVWEELVLQEGLQSRRLSLVARRSERKASGL